MTTATSKPPSVPQRGPKFIPQALPEVVLIDPLVHRDHRGFFLESYNLRVYSRAGIQAQFVQDNLSRSTQGILRGLHAQLKNPQGKLVRVLEGEIFDVAVDIRVGSPTFGQWVGVLLTASSFQQLYIPPGFAHGFCVRTPHAQVAYKVTTYYDPTDELAIAWNDPDLGIDWGCVDPTVSARDSAAPTLREAMDRLPRFSSPAQDPS